VLLLLLLLLLQRWAQPLLHLCMRGPGALAQSMLRRPVRAEHAGCDGSLGNLTGCIEVLLLPVVLLLLLLLLLLLRLRSYILSS
jgi:hypothetical protein